jgi:[ribosomal protein S18]-alanine N-acetyltransferase
MTDGEHSAIEAALRVEGGAEVFVRALASETEARACAEIMSSSQPWLTLGRGFDQCLGVIRSREQEAYVALHDGLVVGFVLLVMTGALVGYIRSVAVRDDWRSRGLGRQLVWFAEQRIHRRSPNVFLTVSSFNPRARALYEHLGYETIGELRDYIVRGHSEWLMRKTLSPIDEWREEER